MLSDSLLVQNAGFSIPNLQGFQNLTSAIMDSQTAWKDKKDERVYWRGKASGGLSKDLDWRFSHRYRLHLFIAGPSVRDAHMRASWSSRDTWGRHTPLLPQGKDGFEQKSFSQNQFAKRYMDMTLVGRAMRMEARDGVLRDANEGVVRKR